MIGVNACAGFGNRLKRWMNNNYSDRTSKELCEVGGTAVLNLVVQGLYNIGVDKQFIIIGREKGDIIKYVGSGNKKGLEIAYLIQEERLGLPDAFRTAESWIDEDRFIGHVGDAIIWPLTEVRKVKGVKKNYFGKILIREVKNPTLYGIIKQENNLLVDCFEKPSPEEAKPFKTKNGKYYVNLGIYNFKTSAYFECLEKTLKDEGKGEWLMPDVFKTALSEGYEVEVSKVFGKYCDIGNEKSAYEVIDYFKKIKKQGVMS